MKRHHKRLWFGIFLSTALVVYLLRGTDFRELAGILRQANYLYCIPMIGVALAGILVRAYRWKFIMAPLHPASLANLYSSTMLGFMANFILPARIGEFIRAYLIGRKENLSKSAAFGTIVVERLFDIFTITLILCAVLVPVSRPASGIGIAYARALTAAGMTMAAIFLGLLLFILLLKQKTRVTLHWVAATLKFLPRAWGERTMELLRSFVTGLGAVRSGRHLYAIVFYSLLMWGVYALGNLFLLKAFRIELPFYVAFYLLVVQAIGVAVPSGPGFVGTYHAAVVAGLAAFNISQERGLSFAILAHFLMIAPVIAYGLVLLWKDHLSLHALESEAAEDHSTLSQTP